MRIAIHYHRHRSNREIDIYREILEFNGIEVTRLDITSQSFWHDIAGVDALIYKWGHTHDQYQLAHTYIPVLEQNSSIKIFPNYATCWHYDDKIKQDILLKQAGFPFVESWIFWDKQDAFDWIKTQAQFPLVFKLARGAGARSVYLVRNEREAGKFVGPMFRRGISQENINVKQIYQTKNKNALRTLKDIYKTACRKLTGSKEMWQISKNYVYFQKFCPNNAWDTRVTTAGLRAHAFKRFVREGDFRASGSGNWDISPTNIDKRMVRIALDISKHFGFQAMAYDFVVDENNEPRIVEISYCYGGAGYPDFMNGYWDYDLNWHEGRYWPQYFELLDLLDLPEMKCPNIVVKTNYKNAHIRI